MPNIFGNRAGFTALELVLVLTLVGVLSAASVPEIMGWVTSSRVDNAARVVAADLRLATTLASRQGRPVRFQVDEGAMEIRIVDPSDGSTLHVRPFGAVSEFPVQSLIADPDAINLYPDRTGSSAIQVTVVAGDRSTRVDMSSAAFIRVTDL